MKKKYYHKKLIRDKIPELIKSSGNEYKVRKLNTKEFEKELKKKLLEETEEILKAKKKDIPEELADALEVVKSIASHYKIPFSKIEKIRNEKGEKRGSFEKKLFLVWTKK